jgi:hypothetical protein
MIYEILRHLRREKRYRQISKEVTEAITEYNLRRLDKTLTEAYVESTKEGSTKEQQKAFNQLFIDKASEALARENAVRIRQWTEAILEQEEQATQ